MAQHSSYWSGSKLADKIRGTNKLKMGTGTAWREWREEAKAKHKFRYWIAEELLDNIQDFVTWPYTKFNDIRYYINNRWITRTNSLTASKEDVSPGEWCDLTARFLPCLFNELVDFVEIELAWSWIMWNSDDEISQRIAAKNKWNPFHRRTKRCVEAGLKSLEWQSNLGKEGGNTQSADAKEILALYRWWTVERKDRPDEYEASGWSAYSEFRRQSGENFFDSFDREHTKEQAEEAKLALQKLTDIEKLYHDEDEEMMIRLIKIKHALWT